VIPCRCPACGRVWRAWPTLPANYLPTHREPRGASLCTAMVPVDGKDPRRATVLDAVRAYVIHAEARAESYRFRADVRRDVMRVRGELPGDVADLCRWDARAAVWAQRALWVRAAIEQNGEAR
jgi:hypothetical protein